MKYRIKDLFVITPLCLFAVQRSGLESPVHLRHASFLEPCCEGEEDPSSLMCQLQATSLMRFPAVCCDTVARRPDALPALIFLPVSEHISH